VKLADFGIARVASDYADELQDNLGSSGDSVAYASLEVSPGGHYFFPTDVWSFGIVMY
jgi:serine/threonine protein kinase